MKVLVTGATGFVGKHVVSELLNQNHEVTAVARSVKKARAMPWYKKVKFITGDIHDKIFSIRHRIEIPDVLIHLAWSYLDDYDSEYHFIELYDNYVFLNDMIESGTKHILVTGTCLEYGMQNGALSSNTPTEPTTTYGLAKDTLRKFLQQLQKKHPFILQWVRLFYMYGEGQNPKSLLVQLDKAIDNNDTVFNMSGGEQLRDYLPVEAVARQLVSLMEYPEISGVTNCCNGYPTSVRSLVERRIAERKSNIKLNLWCYPYPDYEPMAFWGV